ncbi:MAG: hypothetical protein JOZ69_10055 [Myxococcales bacterium]|nr:hypothetical protein [Myxococcales bacterium]
MTTTASGPPISVPLLERRRTHFLLWLLWRTQWTDVPPALFIQRYRAGQGIDFATFRELPLARSELSSDLLEIPAADCGLEEGGVYLYWFKLRDAAAPGTTNVLYCTDPFAWAVDRSTLAPAPADPNGVTIAAPASVVGFRGGRLVPVDVDGRPTAGLGTTDPGSTERRDPNNQTVIYELPTRWVVSSPPTSPGLPPGALVGTGTFADVVALLVPDAKAPSFPKLTQVNERAHLVDLGANALELLPPADSSQVLEWGYGTANYFAADFDLGRPAGAVRSEATAQLVQLVRACHDAGVRFFPDVVMAFTRDNTGLRDVNDLDLLVEPGTGDPQERRTTDGGSRAGFGGNPFRYAGPARPGFDPVTGADVPALVPARQYMKTYVTHWMTFFGIDGVRVDDVADIDNWDFNGEFTRHARAVWRSAGGDDARFIVISEELGRPAEFARAGKTDASWNEPWKRILRNAILGRNADDEPSFEWSVRKLIDCSLLGFGDLSQAVNYLGSHDVGGFRNERIFNFLVNNGVQDVARRLKLAFACLLTAAGIPMIFAGDEFADSQDLPLSDAGDRNKQIDPVKFDRLSDPWRRDLFDQVARLVRLRTSAAALARNETSFLHVDFEGKRVLVWQRGLLADPVVVVANFSDYASPGGLGGEYVIPAFPDPEAAWYEVSQGAPRRVTPAQVGREPIFAWEAKIYRILTN